MARYRQRPPEIDAEHYRSWGLSGAQLVAFTAESYPGASGAPGGATFIQARPETVAVEPTATAEAWDQMTSSYVPARDGDYVQRGAHGELTVIPKAVFEGPGGYDRVVLL